MNTFGLNSINRQTFNIDIKENQKASCKKYQRDRLFTVLKLHNLVLNILACIPKYTKGAACIRLASASILILTTLIAGNRNTEKGFLIGTFYDEAIITGIAQIVRATLEIYIPLGPYGHLALDIIATPINIAQNFGIESFDHFRDLLEDENHSFTEKTVIQEKSHKNPDYPIPISFLLNSV